jgi:hypothetical protein
MRRRDLPFFQLNCLCDFDHKRTHNTVLSTEYNLNVSDIIEWEAGQNHHGYAEIMSVRPSGLSDYVTVELRER